MQCKRYDDFMREFQYYRTFLWNYRKTKRPFTDHYFHPKMNIPEYKVDMDKSKVEWHRVDEYYKAPLFDEKLINIEYVKQGTLGDCSFISALSRVAKQPELVSRLFDKTADTILGKVKKSVNIKCGAVVIFFHAFGQETPVLIDTYLPFFKGTTTPIFSRPVNFQVSPWFCLVEKAFAKLYGSYSNIIGVHFVTSIYSLFGYQPLFKSFSDLEKEQKVTKKSPFKRILEYQSQGAVMDTSIFSGTSLPKNELKKLGLVSDHSYLLIKAIEYNGKHFLNLRNPWGNFEWNGDWSNDSPLWTKQMIKALNMKKAQDGSFWMIEKDYFKYFTDINVSRPIPKEWHSKTFSLQMCPNGTDGDESRLNELKLDDRPNYVVKITEKVPPSQKVSLFFVIERRPYLPGKVTIINDKPSKFMIIIAYSNGQKLTSDVLKRSNRIGNVSTHQLSYFKHDIENPKDSITIAIHRLEKRKEIEECSIRLSCKYDFELYDVNDPDEFIEDNDNSGKIFSTVTGVHKIIQQTKKKNRKFKNFYDDVEDIHDDDEDDDDYYNVRKKQSKKVKIKIHTREVDDDDDDDEKSDDMSEEYYKCLLEKCLTPEDQQKIRQINELDKKQLNLKDEINDLEDQLEYEEDEKRCARLNKKIESKRDEMEELETKIELLLDEDKKSHEKLKRKFEDESDDNDGSDKKSKRKPKPKKVSDSSDSEDDKKSKRKPKPKPKIHYMSDDEESDTKSKRKPKKVSEDSDSDDDKKSKRKPKPKKASEDSDSEDDKKSKRKPKSKKASDDSDSEDDKKSKRKPKPKEVSDSSDSEDDKKSKRKSKK